MSFSPKTFALPVSFRNTRLQNLWKSSQFVKVYVCEFLLLLLLLLFVFGERERERQRERDRDRETETETEREEKEKDYEVVWVEYF